MDISGSDITRKRISLVRIKTTIYLSIDTSSRMIHGEYQVTIPLGADGQIIVSAIMDSVNGREAASDTVTMARML